MKKQFLKTLLLAGITVFFYSCSTGGGEKAAQAEADTNNAEDTEEAQSEETSSEETTRMLMVWHTVEDYDAWRPAYDGNLPNILEGGMTRAVVGREHGNENNVFVAQAVNNLEAARGFSTSDELKAKMEEGGVTGVPQVNFVDVVEYGGAYHDNLERVLVRYKIEDWDTFKPIFDTAVAGEGEPGLQFLFMGRDTDDGNMITIVNIVTDREKAEAYIGSDDLRSKMDEATVGSEVEIKYFTAEYIDDDAS